VATTTEPVVSMKQLLEAGVHFGHQTRRWNPKMKRFIFGERNGIYIIDLDQTLRRIETAYTFVRDLVAGGGTILFIGTKKQAQDPIRDYADKCGMPYVNERWLGGMLTNFETIAKRVAKMQEYERMKQAGDFEAMPKKEALLLSRELEKLQRNLGGLRSMTRRPDAVFILDTKKEHIGVTEANKLGVPIVAVVDTNCDPDLIQYVIPGNDDAIRSGTLLCRVIADAVEEGRFIASRRSPATAAAAAGPAPRSNEDEARVASEQAEARREAAQAQAEREARIAASRAAAEAAAGGRREAAADVAAETTDQSSVTSPAAAGEDVGPEAIEEAGAAGAEASADRGPVETPDTPEA
jgi:small subunit ribosomal protein S2